MFKSVSFKRARKTFFSAIIFIFSILFILNTPVFASSIDWLYSDAEKMVDDSIGITTEQSTGFWQGTVELAQHPMVSLNHAEANASVSKYLYIKLAVENPNNIDILFTVNRKYHFSEGIIFKLSGFETSGDTITYRFDCSSMDKWSFGINPLLLEFNGCKKGAKIKLYNIGVSTKALGSVDGAEVKNGRIDVIKIHQNDRMAAFHQTLVSTDELKPNSMLETYMDDKFSHVVHYQLAKIAPSIMLDGNAYGCRFAYDVDTNPIYGGVLSTYRIGGVKLKTEIIPLMRGRDEQAWYGVALYRISTEPATAIRIKCGEGSEMSGFTDNRALRLRSDKVGAAADTAISDDGVYLLNSEGHSLTVGVQATGQTNIVEGDGGGKILDVSFESGRGEMLLSFSADADEAKELLRLDAGVARKEVQQHYNKLLQSKIKTPSPVLDEAFKHAIITNEYVWLNPYGWMECIHHWTAMWHMQNSAAACWLGQEERSKACLKSYSEKMTPDGQIMHLVPGGHTFRSFGGSNQFYLWQGKHYLDFTNDHSMREYLSPYFDKAIKLTYDEYDPDGDMLLGWGFQIGNQEDFIVTPYNGTTPTIEGIQMLRARADMAKEFGDVETERIFRNRINIAMSRLKSELWQKDIGRFIYFKDPDGNKRLDGQYHTFIYPSIYDITDPLDNWSSIRHVRDRLTNEDGGVYCSNQFGEHVNGTWGMQAGAAQQPWAAMGLAAVGLRNEAYRPLKWIAEFVNDEVHKGSWPEVAFEVMPAYFSPPSGLYIQAMVEAIFGLKLNKPDGILSISPSFPDDWPEAELSLPHFQVRYEKENNTYRYEVDSNELFKRKLRWKLPVGDVVSARLNGKKTPYQVAPGVGCIVVSVDTKAMKSSEFVIKLKPSNYLVEQPRSIAEGDAFTLNVKDCEIVRVDDRADVLSSLEIKDGRVLKGRVGDGLLGDYLKYGRLGLMNFARRSFFILCRTRAGTEFWVPVDITILPRSEATFIGQLQKDGTVEVKIRNNTSSALSGTVGISAGRYDVFFDVDILARSEETYTAKIPEKAIGLLSVGDNRTTLTLPDGSILEPVLTASDIFRDVEQLNKYAAERIVSIELPENLLRDDTQWKQWSAVYTYPHGQWANSRPVLEGLNASKIQIPQLPGVVFKINDRKVVPVSARAGQPFVEIDLKQQPYKKIYLLVACLADNHDMFAQLGQITVQRKNIDTEQARQIGPGQFVKKLYMPGDLDWWSPESIVGVFSTAKRERKDRYGLLPLLKENESDWTLAKPPAFPQIEYWATGLSYRTLSAEMNVIEVDMGKMTIADSLRVSTNGPDACLAVIAVSGETTGGVKHLDSTPWMPDSKFREPRTVFEITDANSVKDWTFEGDAFSVASVKPLFDIPTLNTLARGESVVGKAVSPDFVLIEGDQFLNIICHGGRSKSENGAGLLAIDLVDSTTGQLLERTLANGSHKLQGQAVNVEKWTGRTVHLEVIDKNSDSSYAWIGISKASISYKK